MSYLHIPNLYRAEGQLILALRRCWALEKLHGTSAHITYKTNPSNKSQWQLTFFSGGESYNNFIKLFDKDILMKSLGELGLDPDKELTIYGECYGGSQQGMSETYGTSLKFGVFDIQIGDCWLAVPQADEMAQKLGLEFVPYQECSTDLADLDAQRDLPSVQAIRNGVSEHCPAGDEREKTTLRPIMGFKQGEPCWFEGRVLLNPRKREGVVLRPLFEIRLNGNEEAGHRLICKHKGDDFKETKTARPVVDPAKMAVLTDATAIAEEWVTAMRLEHVIAKLPSVLAGKPLDMSLIPELIKSMTEDVLREASGEITEGDAVKKAIGKKAVEMYKVYLKSKIT